MAATTSPEELTMAARTPSAKRSVTKTTTATKTAATKRKAAPRPDDRYFAEQPADKRALLEKLRAVVMRGVPDATVSIKWGVPFYARDGTSICALAAFKDDVAINFFAPPEVLVDPGKKLEGAGTRNRMLKIRTAADIDGASILRWLKAAIAANR
jgi:hypothetical protein